jgi:hypothetical protein
MFFSFQFCSSNQIGFSFSYGLAEWSSNVGLLWFWLFTWFLIFWFLAYYCFGNFLFIYFYFWVSVLAEQRLGFDSLLKVGPLFEENMFRMLLSFSWLAMC